MLVSPHTPICFLSLFSFSQAQESLAFSSVFHIDVFCFSRIWWMMFKSRGDKETRDTALRKGAIVFVSSSLSIPPHGGTLFTPVSTPKHTSKTHKKKDPKLIQEFDGRGIPPCQICIAFGGKFLFFYTYLCGAVQLCFKWESFLLHVIFFNCNGDCLWGFQALACMFQRTR